jgi:hypothetical protein
MYLSHHALYRFSLPCLGCSIRPHISGIVSDNAAAASQFLSVIALAMASVKRFIRDEPKDVVSGAGVGGYAGVTKSAVWACRGVS